MMLAKSKTADLDFPQYYVQMPNESHACAELKLSVSRGSEPQIFHLMLAKSKRADLDFPQYIVQMRDESHACAE